MITVEEAKQIVIDNSRELTEVITIKAIESTGYKLVEDIFAPLDLPPFNQSNVDGYAVSFSEHNTNTWNVVTEIKAGDNATTELKSGEAARIYTGAMVPGNSVCVIMQEKINRTQNSISCADHSISNGEHIRKKGAQIKQGELAVKKETVVNPSIIGFISSLGITEIKVYRKPKIALIITGNELQETGAVLEPGKVYESNSASLSAAVNSLGLTLHEILFVKDDKESLFQTVNASIDKSDVLLISGGISVGDYDFVNEVLIENNTETLFYKIAQKPGKPLYFGKNKHTLIFGLPGNPASALTCFYEYVYPCLKKLQGKKDYMLPTQMLALKNSINKKKGLANFLKAYVDTDGVTCLEGQESFKMRAFTETNAFIYLEQEKENSKVGGIVEVHLLPES